MDSTSLLHETKISVRDTTEDVDTCAYYGTINAYNYAMRSIRSLGMTDREDKPIVLLSLLWGNSYDLGTNMLFGLLDLILRFPVLLLSLAVTINSIVHMANDGNFFDGDHQYQIVLGLFALTLLHGHFYYVIRRNQQVLSWGALELINVGSAEMGYSNRFLNITGENVATLSVLSVDEQQALLARMRARHSVTVKVMLYNSSWKNSYFTKPRNWLFTVFWWYLAALIISVVDLFFVYL